MALTADHNHAEAFNNLGVLEMRRGKVEQVPILQTLFWPKSFQRDSN
jgi:hypothetical protein